MLLAFLAVAAGHHQVNAGDEPTAWETDYARIRQTATDKNHPILLSIGSNSCFWCKKLHSTTFRNPNVVATLTREFVTGKVDAGQNRELIQALKVQVFPTLVFAAPDGTILHSAEGYQTVEEMENTLHHAQKLLQVHREKAILMSQSKKK